MGNQSSASYDEMENINLTNYNLASLPYSPSKENKTKYLYLSGNELKSLSKNMKNIMLIDLSANKIGKTLPPEMAGALSSYSNLKTLYLKKNKLENLDNFGSNSVETMFLVQNNFHELPYQFFSKFPQLKTLYLDCNFLTKFSKQTSQSISSLYLSLNCIQTIEVSTLSLPQLSILSLAKNQIRNLPNNFSKSFPNLHNLDLSDNFIEEIPEDESFFPKTLKELILANNSIKKVPASITSLPNLTFLNFTNNKVTAIPQLNQSIIKLYASHNEISQIDDQELNCLEEIQIFNNKITVFPIGIKSQRLNRIYIDHNEIKEINSSQFTINNNLTTIDLSFNNIEVLPKDIFECYPNLLSLFVHFNNITEIPSEISFCSKLNAIDVSFNPIKKLPKLPRSMAVLYASNCQLESFGEQSFVDGDSQLQLRQVDLSGNEIESFMIVPSIQILNLSQNKIKEMPIITANLKILDLSLNLIDSNVSISSQTLVDLNLAHNRLTKMPQVQSCPLLQYLELSGNKIEGTFDITNFAFLERVDFSETNVSISGNNQTLNEIITSRKSDLKADDKKTVYLNISKSGYSEILGMRNKMEDSIILRDDLNLYAVFDGHGGSETAKFASIEMSKLFESAIQNNQLNFENPTQIFLDIFQKVEKGIEANALKDGSTLCLALVCKDSSGKRKIVTAHLGDARALIVKSDGKSRELTKDHKPSMRSEFERIHNIHGFLSKDDRVDGILAVSRSLGDFNVFGLGRDPDVNEFEIMDDDKFLVICCDGVFDVLSNDDVSKIAFDSASTKDAAFKIRNAAFGCKSYDNISVIVIGLEK